ncbi:MAG: hypothetical protein COC06_04880 [Bacteroidales bacterium]|nr:MAG: hypothetical protein COC06_04880 [Bacteroidales bacterium]
MRLIFTICTLFCCTSLLLGQTEKGKILFGGSSNLNFSSIDDKWKIDGDDDIDLGSSTKLEFAPKVGYFVVDGFAIGLELPVSFDTEKNGHGGKTKINSIAAVTFARYYFSEKKVKPYLHGGIGFGSSHYEYKFDSYEEDYDSNLFLYELSGGVAIFLNDIIAIDLGLGYQAVISKPKEDMDDNRRNILSGVAFNVGFSISL